MRTVKVATAMLSLVALMLPPMPVAAGQAVTTYSRPKSIPESASSNFDASLRCMDELLERSAYAKNIPIFVAPLDKEETVGVSTRDMLIAALARMSERSRTFTIRIATEGTIKEDLKKQGGDTLIVGGSITAFEKAVGSAGGGGGLSVGPVGLGFRSQVLDSVISMTLFMQNIDGVVIPSTTQSVSMALKTKSKGGDLSASVGVVGGFLALDFAKADGPMQAVRALVDLTLIQSIGSWSGVPYQRCLTLSQSDPQAIQAARKAFDRMKSPEQLRLIAQGLRERGLYSGPAPTGSMSQELRQAIASFQMQQRLPPLGLPSFEVYYALYGERYGAPAAPATATIAEARQPNPLGLRVAPYGPNFIDADSDVPTILTHRRASFAVSVVRNAHVTCFYTDADNLSTRIFPNPNRRSDVLAPRETLVLPGPTDIYTIEPETPGTSEFVTCAASSQPIGRDDLGDLAPPIQPRATPLPVANAAVLEKRLRGLGLPELSVLQLRYRAVCRTAAGALEDKC